jgi:Transport protein Trs120 or TRAPPC9, TRAPP II complex subunit
MPLRDLVDDRLAHVMFNPLAFPQGQLLFEYLTDWDSRYAYLDDFQHWRKLYAVCPTLRHC